MSSQLEITLRLLLAVGLSAAIGYQRERKGKAAGLRTHILIGSGSALFTLASMYGFSGAVDPSRVAAGVVAGVGFIGAGVIFRGISEERKEEVAGLTGAACIWVTAAIGLAAGAGMFFISVITTLIVVGVLMLPKIRD
ncbi:MAG: MgtC/SapB family protein [Dehalococcoidia bacterium]|nr:MgtC/SapB family protein [Dehalococcoidia bacterium]